MRKILLRLVAVVLTLALHSAWAVSPSGRMTTCQGKFPNPVTDVCWSCVFPISIFGASMGDGQDIPGDNGSPTCVCPAPPPLFKRIGATTGYWEPVRSVDITRKPFCLVGLGGIDMAGSGGGSDQGDAGDGGFLPAPEHSRSHSGEEGGGSFYQAHWYSNPVMYLLEIITDANCVESGSMDVGFMTEIDFTWNDDEMTNILNFESSLFANLLTQAMCAIDCLLASIGLPVVPMYWCNGCNGSNFPLNGYVQTHIGGIQAASLISSRLTYRLQRLGINKKHHSYAAVCGSIRSPVIDKVAYKQQIQYPRVQTEKAPYCCNWQGGTTTLSGAGKEFPYSGEDFSLFMFRKRVCCTL